MAATTNGERRFVFSATQANFQEMVVENSRKEPVLGDFRALFELTEIHRRDPGFRNGIGRRGQLAIVDPLSADDCRAASYRRILFQH